MENLERFFNELRRSDPDCEITLTGTEDKNNQLIKVVNPKIVENNEFKTKEMLHSWRTKIHKRSNEKMFESDSSADKHLTLYECVVCGRMANSMAVLNERCTCCCTTCCTLFGGCCSV